MENEVIFIALPDDNRFDFIYFLKNTILIHGMKTVNDDNIFESSFYSELEFKSETKDKKDSYRFPYILYPCNHFHFIIVVALII